jgi:thiol-disulfide isomerase/thioredoxin
VTPDRACARFSVSVAALCTVCWAPPADAQEVGIPIGATPPAVEVESLDGDTVSLAVSIGERPVLLQFWARWCTVCEALRPQLGEAATRFAGRVEFVAVAVAVNQTPRSVRRYLEQHPVPYPVVWDVTGAAVRAYRAPTTGYVVILDADGRVAYTGVGEQQDLVAALERIVGG